MKLRRLFRIKKSRKYPIKRNGEGLSLRERCFELFEQGKRPVDVAGELKMEETTVCRYFRDWKRLGPHFEPRYTYVQSLFKKTAPDRDENVELFARACNIPKEQLEAILSQPHGLRRLMTGKLYFPANADADHKRHLSLELALLIADHLTKNGGKLEDVYFALKRYMQENMKYRQQEDADIEEHNKYMGFFHKVLATDMEKERRGQLKPDTFSEEERNTVIRLGLEREMKKVEIAYWLRIGSLKAEGITTEQAREKIYQDLLEKGDLKGAKVIREFQDKVHPLKTDDQMPQPSLSQLPPAPHV
jgi:hypothetical protein